LEDEMRCPICNEETVGQETRHWGPEFAHLRCIKAYSLGGQDARRNESVKIADLERQLEQAVKYLRQGKAEFAPNTTNSDVDVFLAAISNESK
jgi:hypothetical protein